MLRATQSALIGLVLARGIAVAQDSPAYSSQSAAAPEARIGLAVPLTLAGEIIRTQRPQAIEPGADPWNSGFRATAYPSLKLGEHWYFYSAIQMNSEPYFYYESYYPERDIEAKVLQAFVGYRWTGERSAVGVKAGHLSSAFGEFPTRYDETANPLIDQPLAYSSYLRIRPDALPCGVKDLPNLRPYAEYVGVRFYCGGPETAFNGLPPATLYGLPGAELDVSVHNFDARFQLTNSSPANPQSLLSESQHAQWTAGAGLTLWQGFRVGVSGMRGPFLERNLEGKLPVGHAVRDYPATGIGADIRLSRGRWSASAEWLRASFSYPRLFIPLTVHSAYGELKAIIKPRWFAAFRGSWQIHNRLIDKNGQSPLRYQPNTQAYELAIGFRPNRWQLLKVGYERLHTDGVAGHRNDVLGFQFVTSLDGLSIAIQ